MNKKIISAVVSAAIVCGAMPVSVNAEETEKSVGRSAVSLPHFSTDPILNSKSETPVQVPTPGVSYGSGSKRRSTRESYPSSLDLRDYGYVTSIKDQGDFGTCWAHAAISSAESSILMSNPLVDLSELHTAFYAFYGDDQILDWSEDLYEKLNRGGNYYMVTNLWSQGIGPVSEKRLPYYNLDFFDNENNVLNMSYQSDYRLKKSHTFDFNWDRTNADAVNELVKRYLYDGRVVDVSYYSNTEVCYNYDFCTSNSVKRPKFADHAVSIIGWDDNYPAENFNIQPSQDGAWLIKNSWGYDFGNEGTMWISYEDESLCEFAVYDLDDSDEYLFMDHYDTFIPMQSLAADVESNSSYMANVFKNYGEGWQLEAISTYVTNPDTEYYITIYTDLSDINDPTSGTPSATTYAYFDTTGYFTIELDENVILHDEEDYSVVINAYNPNSSYVIPIEACSYVYDEEYDEIISLGNLIDYNQLIDCTGEGESFYSADGSEWFDITHEEWINSDEDVEYILQAYVIELYDGIDEDDEEALAEAAEMLENMKEIYSRGPSGTIGGNISIKIYQNPVNTVDFSEMSGCVDYGDTISLSVKDGSDIYYSVGDDEWELYSEPISIEGLTYITATADFETFMTRSYIPYDLFMDTPYGDINADLNITPYDASMVLTHYACLATGVQGPIGKAIIENADYDGNGSIDPLDASMILSRYAELATGGE